MAAMPRPLLVLEARQRPVYATTRATLQGNGNPVGIAPQHPIAALSPDNSLLHSLVMSNVRGCRPRGHALSAPSSSQRRPTRELEPHSDGPTADSSSSSPSLALDRQSAPTFS